MFKYTIVGIINNFNKRGVFTNYWVINDDKDVHDLFKDSNIAGIMSDRPVHVKNLLSTISAQNSRQKNA